MSHFVSMRRCTTVWSALAALGLGLRLWSQTPATAGPGGWQTSAQVTQGWDSNVLLSTTNPQAAASTQYQLSLGRDWVGPRSSFSAVFRPQGEMVSGHSNLNYVAESYQQDWTYAWRHSSLTWSLSAERMPERAGGLLGGGGGGAAGAAAASFSLSLATVLTSGSTMVGFTHQYSQRSSWTASATAGLQVFSRDLQLLASLAPGNPLILQAADSRSRTAGGGVSWAHQLTERRSVSLSANASQMWYSGPARALLYTSLQASLQQQLGAGVTLSVGGGPAWNRTLGAAGAAGNGELPGASYAANASLIMQHGHSQYGLTWDRSERASMVPGGVTTQLLGLRYGVQWGPSWSASASAGFSQFAGVAGGAGVAASAGRGSTYTAAQLSYRIASGWSLQTGFSFNSQSLRALGGGSVPLHRAHVSFGLSYQSGGAR